ncbi:MAG: hypothetical protein CNIPEHKO_03300 [Anaerolineales bacterium]|nr:hypothetical protein [Anaerolineales bacterium]
MCWIRRWKLQTTNHMDNKPTFDRAFVIPLALGVFALFGICLVLLLGQLSSFRSVSVVSETSTPFKYLLLGTEPGFTTLTPDDSAAEEGATSEPTTTPFDLDVLRPTSTEETEEIDATKAPTKPSSVLTQPASSKPTKPASAPTSTAPSKPTTSPSNAPLNPGTYDDFDAHIQYEGNWIEQVDVPDAFEDTLHVSNILNNSLSFRFIGEQIRIFYQEGPGLGSVRISLDGLDFDLNQSASATSIQEWPSRILVNGTHSITITHLSGGSINLDSLIVPDPILTPTPTATP